jgi:hypothetical protein
METEINEKIEFGKICSSELLDYISFKEEYPKEAEWAFIEFCKRFEKDLLQKAEVYCAKFGYNEVVALDVANCTFSRVWKYPSFNLKKAKSKDVTKAILLWLYPIMYTQILKFQHAASCAEPTEEEDLCLITDLDGLVNKISDSVDVDDKKKLKAQLKVLESAFLGLTEKHKIIYLTYKAYERAGKNIPRGISKKLQDVLDLVPVTIRIYKRDTNLHVENYIKQHNAAK